MATQIVGNTVGVPGQEMMEMDLLVGDRVDSEHSQAFSLQQVDEEGKQDIKTKVFYVLLVKYNKNS